MLKFCTRKYIFLLLAVSLGLTVSSCFRFQLKLAEMPAVIQKTDKTSSKTLANQYTYGKLIAMDTLGNDKVLALVQTNELFKFDHFKFKTKRYDENYLKFYRYQYEIVLDYRRDKNIITVLTRQEENNMIFKRVFDLKKKKNISIEVINSTIDDKEIEFEPFTDFEGREAKYNIDKLLKFAKDYYYPKDILNDLDDPEETTVETYFSDKKQAMLLSLPLENNQFAIKVFDKDFKVSYTKRIVPTDFITVPKDVDIDDIEYTILNRSLQEDGTLYLTMSLDIEDLAQSNLVVAKISKDGMDIVKHPENFYFNPKTDDFDYDDYLDDRLNSTKTIVENNKFHIYCYHNYDNEFMGITHNTIDFAANTCSETVQMELSNDIHTYYDGEDIYYPSYINSLHKLENGNILIEFERDNFESEHIVQGTINSNHTYKKPIDLNTKGGLSFLMLDKNLKRIWHTFLRSQEHEIDQQIYTATTNFMKPNTFEKNSDITIEKKIIESIIKTDLGSDFNSVSRVKIDIATGKILKIKPLVEVGKYTNISLNSMIKLSNGTYVTAFHTPVVPSVNRDNILYFREKR